MPRLRFKDHALVISLVEAAIRSGKPLMLAHDHGVYLCTDAMRDSGGRCLCAFAVGCDPALDEDAFETARALVGGDDFGERIPLSERDQPLLDDLRQGHELFIGFSATRLTIVTQAGQKEQPPQQTRAACGRSTESHPTARTGTDAMTTTAMKKMSKSATSKATAKATGSSEKLRKAAIAEIGERIAKLDGAQAPASEAGASQATTATTVATDAKAARGGKAKAKRAPDATDATDAKPAKSAKPAKEAKVKRLSALDAAAIILKNAKQPMNSEALIVEMANRKLWISPNGQTPSQTLYAALGREINSKGKQSRFTKIERGMFAINPKVA